MMLIEREVKGRLYRHIEGPRQYNVPGDGGEPLPDEPAQWVEHIPIEQVPEIPEDARAVDQGFETWAMTWYSGTWETGLRKWHTKGTTRDSGITNYIEYRLQSEIDKGAWIKRFCYEEGFGPENGWHGQYDVKESMAA